MKKSQTINGWYAHSLKKTFLIMRIIVFLLLATFLQTQANSAYAQRTKLSLNYNNTALEKVLDAIEHQSEFFFLYNEKLVDAKRKVSVKVSEQRIEEILDQLLDGTNVEYSIIDRKIVLAPDDIAAVVQQQRGVTGRVTDRTGAPLARGYRCSKRYDHGYHHRRKRELHNWECPAECNFGIFVCRDADTGNCGWHPGCY